MNTDKIRRAVKRVQSELEDDLFLVVYQMHLNGNEKQVDRVTQKIKDVLKGAQDE